MRVAGGSSSSSLGASQIFCETRLSADGAEDWDFWIFGFRDDDCRGGRQGRAGEKGRGTAGGGRDRNDRRFCLCGPRRRSFFCLCGDGPRLGPIPTLSSEPGQVEPGGTLRLVVTGDRRDCGPEGRPRAVAHRVDGTHAVEVSLTVLQPGVRGVRRRGGSQVYPPAIGAVPLLDFAAGDGQATRRGLPATPTRGRRLSAAVKRSAPVCPVRSWRSWPRPAATNRSRPCCSRR